MLGATACTYQTEGDDGGTHNKIKDSAVVGMHANNLLTNHSFEYNDSKWGTYGTYESGALNTHTTAREYLGLYAAGVSMDKRPKGTVISNKITKATPEEFDNGWERLEVSFTIKYTRTATVCLETDCGTQRGAGKVTSIGYQKGSAAEVGYFFARNGQGDIIAIYRSSDFKLIGTIVRCSYRDHIWWCVGWYWLCECKWI